MTEHDKRTEMLIGGEALSKLRAARFLLFGIGGVGGHVLEALARGGAGGIAAVDCDTVSESNENRQIIATTETLGMKKTEAARLRVSVCAPECEFYGIDTRVSRDNAAQILRDAREHFGRLDFVIDAVDTVEAKLAVIAAARAEGVPVISSMGTGGKLDPFSFRIADISKTNTCPLARVMRRELLRAGICNVPVLFSTELPVNGAGTEAEHGRHAPGSVSYMPGCAGLMIAGYVIRKTAEI